MLSLRSAVLDVLESDQLKGSTDRPQSYFMTFLRRDTLAILCFIFGGYWPF